ncbi:UNVERIFIED_CONTAM: MerR family transcriptional regulator [Microbacterium sp. SLM126]
MHTDPAESEAWNRGVYSIAVAADLVGVGVQTLRLYEAKGVLEPGRTAGGTRRYSDADLHTLRRAIALLAEGINLAGVRRIIQLEDANHDLRVTIAELSTTGGRPAG